MLTLLTAFLVVFISLLFLIKRKIKKVDHVKIIPGLTSSDPLLGNLPDIFQAGSLPAFLANLHAKLGPVASFWFKDVFTVSLGDQKLFRHTERMFDRHAALFEFALPLISAQSIQFENGTKGRERHRMFSKAFNYEACSRLLGSVQDCVKQGVSSWQDRVGLHGEMMDLAISIMTTSQFGGFFQQKERVTKFRDMYDSLFKDFDDACLGSWAFGQGDEREQEFERKLAKFKETVKHIVQSHRERKNIGEYDLAPFLDIALDNIDDDEDVVHQAITFLVGGFHTTGMYLTWLLYYAALYPEVQEKMRQEIKDLLKEGVDGLTMEDVDRLQYVRQVMDETLRVAKVSLWTSRKAEKDLEVNGFLIKEGTQIVNAIGVPMDDETLFPDPLTFDPDRFSPGKTQNNGLAFSPFGFGLRKCPGYRFSNLEVIVTAVEVLSRYRLEVADKDDDLVQPVFGFITKPEREIWLKVVRVEGENGGDCLQKLND